MHEADEYRRCDHNTYLPARPLPFDGGLMDSLFLALRRAASQARRAVSQPSICTFTPMESAARVVA